MLRSYRDLLVWQKAIELTILIYRLSEGFPRTEIYGLTSQIRRASVSVPSNIAEGYGREVVEKSIFSSSSSPKAR